MPETANWFQLSHLGTDIQLLIGYVDSQKVLAAVETEKRRPGHKGSMNVRAEAEITHRMLLSPQGFVTLRATVEQLANLLPIPSK